MVRQTINLATEEFKQELISLIETKNRQLPAVNIINVIREVSGELEKSYIRLLEDERKEYEKALKEEQENLNKEKSPKEGVV